MVHFAAESHVDRSIDDQDAFARTHVIGTGRPARRGPGLVGRGYLSAESISLVLADCYTTFRDLTPESLNVLLCRTSVRKTFGLGIRVLRCRTIRPRCQGRSMVDPATA